jgi:hypothetical protein
LPVQKNNTGKFLIKGSIPPKHLSLPGSGYYAATDGSFTLNEVMASNTPPCEVTVIVRNLASGKSIKKTFSVK